MILEGNAKKLAGAAIAVIADDVVLFSVAQVDDLLQGLQIALRASDSDVAAVRNWLHTQQILSMDKGLAVSLPHDRWLHRRPNLDSYYWGRFRKLLLSQGWGPGVIRTMDSTVDEILDLAGDPHRSGPWDRRGLVVGEVQSGKTATYTALINKAADAGYIVVVLLAGSLNSLRYQTQLRLDEGFIGYDSAERVSGQTQPAKPVGVGRFDLSRIPNAYTSRLSDFDIKTASVRFRLAGLKEPVLLVVKKNKLILDNLHTYLRGQQSAGGSNLEIPLLFIDDEADNASINTRKDGDPRGINQAIRKILGLFNKSSYIGFTATPFANVFIEPDLHNKDYGADIFPRDFIYALESPSNYIGPRRIFLDNPKRFVREITDGENYFPSKHKKDLVVSQIPDTLIEALRAFLIANAIRDLRGDLTAHRSMLINVSWANAVQDQVEDLVQHQLDLYRQALGSFGALSSKSAVKQSPRLQDLHETFKAEFAESGASWDDVLAALYASTVAIEVRSINMRSKKRLDYDANKTNGLRVIAVGGNALSRGLTLEGLCISYLLRNSEAYDTLMQMGRWFGYRPGYEDLCRLYMTPAAIGWYEHITKATEELRVELHRMYEVNSKPADFGLRVQSHPDKLIVTARNKMRSASEVIDGTVSLSGRRIEATQLPASQSILKKNTDALTNFLGTLEAPTESKEQANGAKVWKDVKRDIVARFLANFTAYNLDFQSGEIAKYLFESDDPKLSRFDVALMSGRGEQRSLETASITISFFASQRGVWKRESYFEIDKRRLGSSGDEETGLSADSIALATQLSNQAKVTTSEDTKRGVFLRSLREKPMLFIYVVDPNPPTADKNFSVPPTKDFFSIALSFPTGLLETGKPLVYQANKVYQRMLNLFEDETDEDEVGAEGNSIAIG